LRWKAFLLPCGEFGLAALVAVRDDQAGASVAAVCDHRRVADGGLRAGQMPDFAVVAVAGQGPTDRDDQPRVGVDDHLVVGGVAVVLRLLGHRMVTRGDQGAVHDEDGVLVGTVGVAARRAEARGGR
jgi:hypothetical protein